MSPHYPARKLEKRVKQAIATETDGTVIYAVESVRRPHGARDEVWLALDSAGAILSRVHTPYRRSSVELTRRLDGTEATDVADKLDHLGVWRLGPAVQPVRDGWACTVVAADSSRLHTIDMLQPQAEHLQLVTYLLSLVSLPEQHRAFSV